MIRLPAQPLSFIRCAGPRTAAEQLAGQLWSTKMVLGLRCRLDSLPAVRPAKVQTTMEPRDGVSFTGFADELPRTATLDHVEVLLRTWFCQAGVNTLYVATSPDGSPMYSQWLIGPDEQDRLHDFAPCRFPTLRRDEVLLEGAYTFVDFRRMGVMADGMAQLLRIARDRGAWWAITYVGAHNVASLRGCASVGFALDHVRENGNRLGRRRTAVRGVDALARARWEAQTAGR
jgi:hypothetical protein